MIDIYTVAVPEPLGVHKVGPGSNLLAHGYSPLTVRNLLRLAAPLSRRHTTAVQLMQAGVDRSVIALWLGHEQIETTQMYLHADLSIKERAIALTQPYATADKRYRADDELLAFLDRL